MQNLKSTIFQHLNVLVFYNSSYQHVPSDLISHYPNVEFIQNKSNLDFVAKNIKAVELLGDSEWVALLNPDAFPEPDWLQCLLDAAENNSNNSIFTSRQIDCWCCQ